jgi:hypothetical protein
MNTLTILKLLEIIYYFQEIPPKFQIQSLLATVQENEEGQVYIDLDEYLNDLVETHGEEK